MDLFFFLTVIIQTTPKPVTPEASKAEVGK